MVMLSMTERVTMLGLSRWAVEGGSYRTIQRFYCTIIPGSGPHCKYGNRVDYHNIPEKYLKTTRVEDGIQTCIYQAQLLHTDFPGLLNVVILVKTNLRTQAWAHVILFSSDLELSFEKLVEYYSLRFQIEFNFRDAKQFWGLEDFMNVNQTAVTNAANLSLFMVNLSQVLMCNCRQLNPDFGVLDLKSYYRGYKYATEMINMLPQKPDDILVPSFSGKSPFWAAFIWLNRPFFHCN